MPVPSSLLPDLKGTFLPTFSKAKSLKKVETGSHFLFVKDHTVAIVDFKRNLIFVGTTQLHSGEEQLLVI